MRIIFVIVVVVVLGSMFVMSSSAHALDLKVGDEAPLFTLPNQEGANFSLESRKGAGWTVLYFYPKAETPGCTKQACAFRDAIEKIRNLGAEVYGISSDTVEAQAGFHSHHQLKFDLLADPQARVIGLYGAKAPLLSFAKRWTFVLDPKLRIRWIEQDVDPAKDPDKVAAQIETLKKSDS